MYIAKIAAIECTFEREGWKRINTNQMHFVKFDVCLDGKWEGKSCDKGSLFWVVPNCCIPIEKYPAFDDCVLTEEEKIRNKTVKSLDSALITPNPDITSQTDEITHESSAR
jgi:hypothetical protein